MKTSARFTFDKVVFDKTNEIHAVLSLTAPKLDRIKKRPPVCIIPVIDVSGSMMGQKLDFVKKSVAKLIDHLSPGDYFGAVAFASDVYPVFRTEAVTGISKLKMQAEVAKLAVCGNTNLSGGMLMGLEFGNTIDLPKDILIRVILFTDGCANAGPASDSAGICKLLTANKGRATLSAFGYGNDADQELLTSIASTGKGNYAFIDDPDKASTAFAKELGGLLSTYAQNISIEVEPLGENEITKVVSDVTVADNDKDKKIKIEMADILAEETRHIVLAIKSGIQKQVFPRPINILAVKFEYDLIDDDGKKTRQTEEVKGKIEFVKEGDEQSKPTQEVVDIVAVHQVLEAQIQAEQHAASGDFVAAYNVMVGVQGACGNQGSQGAAGMAGDLATKYENRGSYAKSAGSRSAYRASSSSRALFADAGTEQVMFSCNLSNVNSAQQAVMDSFSVTPDVDSSQVVGLGGAAVPADFTSLLAATPPASTSSSSGLKKSRRKGW